MEANNARAPSNTGTIKMVNLTDYDFIISQLGGEKVTRAIEYLPHHVHYIIKELDWNEDVNIAKFITKLIIEQEVIRRLEKPEYVVLDVPEEHRGLVKEVLGELDVKVLYIKTEQTETEDGQVVDVRSVVEAEDARPKIILNLTGLGFTDRQIRNICSENYELHYPMIPLVFSPEEDDKVITTYIDHFALQVQDEINEQPDYPDCVILDVPEPVIPYIEARFFGTDIRFVYVKTVFVEMVSSDPLKVKLLGNVEG